MKNFEDVGRLERVALREVWKHEAHDFTQWLENNIDVLNEALDLNLVSADREQSAGDFSVDLVAEDRGGGTVIIENRLEKSIGNRGRGWTKSGATEINSGWLGVRSTGTRYRRT